eukprot:10920243-Alexandrium_andersonii.AAC.1
MRIARTAEPSRRGTCGGWCPTTPAARPPSARRSSVILNEGGRACRRKRIGTRMPRPSGRLCCPRRARSRPSSGRTDRGSR